MAEEVLTEPYGKIRRHLTSTLLAAALLSSFGSSMLYGYNLAVVNSPAQATQVLVQFLIISRLDYCNALLAGLPLCTICPPQLIQNATARLVFNLPKVSHTTPLLRSLHWLPVAARIRFKTLMLAYKAKNGPAPTYLRALITPRTAPRSLRSSSTARLVPPSLRVQGRPASRLFSVLASRWWNELLLNVRTAESLAVFKRRLKTYL
ncbi:uncharacterized protein LOC128317534 [Pangasianodon hypophthalmus]|uniref:uncharacterized protein LOC128317534 n=1 Tax=Pangasianodon hypophthalmus TaxID=310915 RepID=UPI00230701DE|nr:uncharacterized protein LOC128317534 [Pangasianodon hypophthalmus]